MVFSSSAATTAYIAGINKYLSVNQGTHIGVGRHGVRVGMNACGRGWIDALYGAVVTAGEERWGGFWTGGVSP